MPLFRETRSEGNIRNAFCYAVMLHLKREHGYLSIDGERFITTMKVFYAILEMECPEVGELFFGSEHQMDTVVESLTRAKNEGVMIKKIEASSRYFFEKHFENFALEEMRKNLSPKFQMAIEKVMQDAVNISLEVHNWREGQKKIEHYRSRRGH